MKLLLAWAAVICFTAVLMVQLRKLAESLRRRFGYRGNREHQHSTRRSRA